MARPGGYPARGEAIGTADDSAIDLARHPARLSYKGLFQWVGTEYVMQAQARRSSTEAPGIDGHSPNLRFWRRWSGGSHSRADGDKSIVKLDRSLRRSSAVGCLAGEGDPLSGRTRSFGGRRPQGSRHRKCRSMLRSDDTDARKEARRCFGRSHRSAQGYRLGCLETKDSGHPSTRHRHDRRCSRSPLL